MNTTNRQWLWLTGLSALLTAAGCQTAKTETKTSMLPDTAVLSEKKMDTPDMKDQKKDVDVPKEVMPVKTIGSFSTNENLKTVFFALNSSKITEEGETELQKNAEWLQQNPPMLLQIAGYSDSRGSLIRNKTLAERRALKVKEFYVSKGIPKERIIVLTQGAEAPTCEKVTEECLAQSRRVETFIESKDIVSR